MAVNDPNFEENVKLSFIKMKEHANSLELRMKDLEGKMIEILEMFTILKTNVDIKLTLKEEKREEINEFSDNSIGNEGVQASKQASEQATKQASTQAITKQASTLTDPKEIETLFKSIPKVVALALEIPPATGMWFWSLISCSTINHLFVNEHFARRISH